MTKKVIPPKDIKGLPLAVIKQMLVLTTSGFGLVAALAWNEVVKETVNTYIKPYFAKGSSLISLILYAIVITALAVFITLQLTKLQTNLEKNQQKSII